MLLTPHYLRNEKQIPGHESQGPRDPVLMCPLSSHTVFSSKQICISNLATSNSLLFTTLGLHTFCLLCCGAGLSTYNLCGSSVVSLLTLPPSPRWRCEIWCLHCAWKKSVLGLCNILLDCTVSSSASLTKLCTSEPTWRWWQSLVNPNIPSSLHGI